MIRYQKLEQSKIKNNRSLYQLECVIKIFGLIIFKYTYYSDYPESENNDKKQSTTMGYQLPKSLDKI